MSSLKTFSPGLLKAAREHAGLSQAKAARAASVARATVQNAEMGTHVPQSDVLGRMAGAYGVSIDSLFVHEPDADTSDAACATDGAEQDLNDQARAASSGQRSAARAR